MLEYLLTCRWSPVCVFGCKQTMTRIVPGVNFRKTIKNEILGANKHNDTEVISTDYRFDGIAGIRVSLAS